MFNIPSTMKGVQLTGHGDLDVLHYREDLPVPTPCANEVLIKVHASAVNNTDINTRTAWYSKGDNESDDASWAGQALPLPLIQGADVCGVIVAVGDGVSESRVGERVLIEPCLIEARGEMLSTPWYFGSECNGGFADYTTVAARHAHKIDSTLPSHELATFPCSYSTAENMLTRTALGKNERVLITGASGGVGSAAIQLAKARGAYVIAITSRDKQEQIRALGADEVILREQNVVEAIGRNSVHVVIDLVAGKQWPQLLEVLIPKGRYGVAGAIGGAMVTLDIRSLYLKDLSFFGCTVLSEGVFANLVRCIEEGKIKPLAAERYALKDIHQAQSAFVQKQHIGKIVLEINAAS